MTRTNLLRLLTCHFSKNKMRYQYQQKIIKVFILLALLNAVFVGTVTHAYEFRWSDFKTNNFSGTSATVVKNNDYWQITLSGVTSGGIVIGDPYYKQVFPPYNISPWYINYEVVSEANCAMRITYGATTNGLTGSSQINLSTTAATTTTLSFTSPANTAGINGVSFFRRAGTADCVIKLYSITAYDGTILWTPTQNLESLSGQFYMTTSTSSDSGSVTVNTIDEETQKALSFLILLFIYILPLSVFIFLMKQFYDRK